VQSLSLEASIDTDQVKTWIQKLKAGQHWLCGQANAKKWRAERLPGPRLVAYFWNGGNPVAHSIRDISESGLYLETKERWYPQTLVMITLQSEEPGAEESEQSIVVQSKVVRSDSDGVGLAFVPADIDKSRQKQGSLPNGADRATLVTFIRRLWAKHG
jgi:PilZ domain